MLQVSSKLFSVRLLNAHDVISMNVKARSASEGMVEDLVFAMSRSKATMKGNLYNDRNSGACCLQN